MKQHVNPTDLKCHCGREFTNVSALKLHQLKIHIEGEDERKFKCTECSYTAKLKKTLSCHLKSHSKPFSCTKCDKKFSQNVYLKNHLRDHHVSADDLKCCGKQFKTLRAKKIHQFAVHENVTSPVCKCEHCDASFSKWFSYKRHLKIYHQTFICDKCGETFDSKQSIKLHLQKQLQTYNMLKKTLKVTLTRL